MGISEKIRKVYPNLAIKKDKSANSLFEGRNIPSFVKDFIIRKFSDNEGKIDAAAVKEYLAAKMPTSSSNIMMRLLDGEVINITSKVNIKTELVSGQVSFSLPDLSDISADMIIQSSVLEKNKGEISDGESWANISLQYIAPEGKKKGYVLMTSYKPFNPYKNLDFEEFIQGRSSFTTEEWIDVLITIIGYDPSCFKSPEAKLTLLYRLMIGFEPNFNFIEFGPKATGKSFVYNNLTGYFRMVFTRCTRAQLVYNHTTKRWGAVKNHDAVLFDEVTTMQFDDRTGELSGFFKTFCESGTASLANVKLSSTCGIGLVGNIQLDEKLEPVNDDYKEILPDLFKASAMLDRFHFFLKGWKAPRITMGQIYYGWTIDSEYFAEYMHWMRTQSCYKSIFDELVVYDSNNTDTRDCKAVQKVASALCKILFPHVRNLEDLAPEDLELFKQLYKAYCLDPAVEGRAIIRKQCHNIDREFSDVMPVFEIVPSPVDPDDAEENPGDEDSIDGLIGEVPEEGDDAMGTEVEDDGTSEIDPEEGETHTEDTTESEETSEDGQDFPQEETSEEDEEIQ